jgi:hypothetical protein
VILRNDGVVSDCVEKMSSQSWVIKLSPCPVVVAAAECEDDIRNSLSFGRSD